MKKYVVLAAILAAILAVLVGLVISKPNAPREDVCRDLKELAVWVDQTVKHNHQLRIRKPELQNDFNGNGVYHALISVYSHLYALKDKLGCQ